MVRFLVMVLFLLGLGLVLRGEQDSGGGRLARLGTDLRADLGGAVHPLSRTTLRVARAWE